MHVHYRALEVDKCAISTNTFELKLKATSYGKRVVSLIDEAVHLGIVKASTQKEYLRRLTQLFTLGTCAGESYAVSIAWLKNHSQNFRHVLTHAQASTVVAFQALDNLQSDILLALSQKKLRVIAPHTSDNTALLFKLRQKILQFHKKDHLTEANIRKYTALVHRCNFEKKQLEITQDSQFFIPPKLKTTTQQKAETILQKINSLQKSQFLKQASAKSGHIKTFDASNINAIQKVLKKAINKSIHSCLHIGLVSNVINHKIVILSGKKKAIYDSQKGLIKFKHKASLLQAIEKLYLRQSQSVHGTLKKITIESYRYDKDQKVKKSAQPV